MRLRGRGRRLGPPVILGTLLATGMAHAAGSPHGVEAVPVPAAPLLILDRVLYSAVHYPANYGFIPQTYSDDGDPLDVLALCQEPLAPLSIVRFRAIGVFPMRDDRGQDDKILAVHIDDPRFAYSRDIGELPLHVLSELKRFFLDYKVLEDKDVSIEALRGREEAERVILAAVRLYAKRVADLR